MNDCARDCVLTSISGPPLCAQPAAMNSVNRTYYTRSFCVISDRGRVHDSCRLGDLNKAASATSAVWTSSHLRNLQLGARAGALLDSSQAGNHVTRVIWKDGLGDKLEAQRRPVLAPWGFGESLAAEDTDLRWKAAKRRCACRPCADAVSGNRSEQYRKSTGAS